MIIRYLDLEAKVQSVVLPGQLDSRSWGTHTHTQKDNFLKNQAALYSTSIDYCLPGDVLWADDIIACSLPVTGDTCGKKETWHGQKAGVVRSSSHISGETGPANTVPLVLIHKE